jgi:S-adenosylmethionine synthetase
MLISNGLFTSESVSDGHPDKICDQISDAILDACLQQDPNSRVAIETAIKGRTLCLLGEISTKATVGLATIAKTVLADIGHVGGHWGLDPDKLTIVEDVTLQSREIDAGVGGKRDVGAGDQGIMFGFACDETPELMPLPISLAHALMRRHRSFRRSAQGSMIGPDAKAQVTVRYENGRPVSIDTVVISTQHDANFLLSDLRPFVRANIIEPVLKDLLTPEVKLHINPAGNFTQGGPVADAGLTGRKIIVDTYGGYARHGGGAFSGKDATKVDRSGAYAARQLARDVVERGWATACEVRVAYAIGLASPIDVSFETFGTSNGQDLVERYPNKGIDILDLMRPGEIIQRLGLNSPVFRETASFGHFGRSGFTWEQPILGKRKK